jgi:hypothetical protein
LLERVPAEVASNILLQRSGLRMDHKYATAQMDETSSRLEQGTLTAAGVVRATNILSYVEATALDAAELEALRAEVALHFLDAMLGALVKGISEHEDCDGDVFVKAPPSCSLSPSRPRWP